MIKCHVPHLVIFRYFKHSLLVSFFRVDITNFLDLCAAMISFSSEMLRRSTWHFHVPKLNFSSPLLSQTWICSSMNPLIIIFSSLVIAMNNQIFHQKHLMEIDVSSFLLRHKHITYGGEHCQLLHTV